MGIIAADPMGRILRVTAVLCITVGVIGGLAEFGKNRTLRFSGHP